MTLLENKATGLAGKVRVISPAPRDIWREVLAHSTDALPFHAPEWVDSITAVDHCEDATRLYEFEDGARGVLPMVRRRHVFGAIKVASALPPNWGIGGLVVETGVRPEHTAGVFDDLLSLGDTQTYVWPNPMDGPAFAASRPPQVIAVPRLSHVLDLEGGFGEVWSKRFTNATRNHMRRAERSGLTVESDSTGRLMREFHHLLSRSVERWARQQHEPAFLARYRARKRDPLHKFEHIGKRLGEACTVWLARLDGQPAAGIIVLQGTNASYAWGAMDKDILARIPANDLLQRYAIEEACRRGCRYYHMGESGESKALAHFKERLGGRPYPYSEYRIERLPITKTDNVVRGIGKRLIGFRDVP